MYRNCQTFCLKSGVLFLSLSPILHNILWINTVNLSPTIDWGRRGINGLYCGNIHTEIFPGYTYKTFQNVTKRFKTSSLQNVWFQNVSTGIYLKSHFYLLIAIIVWQKTKIEKKIQDCKHGCNRTCKFSQIQNIDVFYKRFWRVFVNLTF
jgi:hypothetical protein